jgi:hypothetical protein
MHVCWRCVTQNNNNKRERKKKNMASRHKECVDDYHATAAWTRS